MKNIFSLVLLSSLLGSYAMAFAHAEDIVALDEAKAKCGAHLNLQGLSGGGKRLRVENSSCKSIKIARPDAPSRVASLDPGNNDFVVSWMGAQLIVEVDGERLTLLSGSTPSVNVQQNQAVIDAARAQKRELDADSLTRKQAADKAAADKIAKDKAAKAQAAAAAVVLGAAAAKAVGDNVVEH